MNKKLIIIDGHALMHRAWHALPPLTAKDGTVVSGAYGFTMILLKAIREFKPTNIAVTFDLPGPTFRHQAYVEYKATREKKPDELYRQFPIALEILSAMNLPVYTAEGYEADDVIGTIAKTVIKEQPNFEVIIVTGDKDTLQLVDDRIFVYTLRKGMTDTVLYNEEEVMNKMGIRPDQLVDYKALRGDPSDNIPGVKGIGDKTAVSLLAEYETLDNLYEMIDKDEVKNIKPAVLDKLKKDRANAFMSKDLALIRCDVKIDFDISKTAYQPITQEKVKDIFENYQFNRLLSQLPKENSDEGREIAGQMNFSDEQVEPVKKQNIDVIADENIAKDLLNKMLQADKIAFRTLSTGGGHPGSQLLYLAMCAGTGVYIFSGDLVQKLKTDFEKIFSDKSKSLICHDLKKEIGVLKEVGVNFSAQAFDIMLASYLLYAGDRRHALDSILSFYRNVKPVDKKDDTENELNRLETEVSHFLSLAEDFETELNKNELLEMNNNLEIPLSAVLSKMERNGILIDVKYLNLLSKDLSAQLKILTADIYELAGKEFNINSPIQLKEILFDELNISVEGIKKTQKGKTLSTAASELEKIKHEHKIIPKILAYRELMKLATTYVDALPPLVNSATKRIHAEFNQTVTATGRLSSSNPNMQNIPTGATEYGKKVRDSFIAENGYQYIAVDYSQIELRLAAHMANEPEMIRAFKNGEDIHWRTAERMFGEEKASENRRIAKAINFGILYGMGPRRLAVSADIDYEEAREYIETYFALHAGIGEYIEKTKKSLEKNGYVETLFGRKRFFPNLHLLNQRERAEAERQAVNMPLQGTSADMIKIAMVNLDKIFIDKFGNKENVPVKMILQVHDELIFEVRKDLVDEMTKLIKTEMEGVIKLKVPIIVDVSVGEKWGSLTKI